MWAPPWTKILYGSLKGASAENSLVLPSINVPPDINNWDSYPFIGDGTMFKKESTGEEFWNDWHTFCTRYGSFNLLQKSAACDKIIGSFSSYRKDYDSLDVIFQNQLFNMSNINTLLDSWYNQIKNAVEEAHSIHGDKEPSIQEWNDNINYLKYSIDQSLN